MARRKKREFQFGQDMDMTPLIDCVFLLILFFILTTELTADMEDVELPFALEVSVKESKEPVQPVVLNVVLNDPSADAEDRGLAKIFYSGDSHDLPRLIQVLQQEVMYDALPPPRGRGRTPELAPNGITKLSQLIVIVRADKGARADYLRDISTACQSVKPKIYKLELSAEQPGGN